MGLLHFISFYFAVCISDAASFSILCDSRFTVVGTSFCVGIPVECTVSLNPNLCINGEDIIMEENLKVLIQDSGNPAVNPPFTSAQTDSLLTLIVDYVPEFSSSIITVEVLANASFNCNFEQRYTGIVKNSPEECIYPLSLTVPNSDPAIVKGGDVIKLTLELSSNLSLLQRIAFFVDSSHPALLLVDRVFISSDGNTTETLTRLVNDHSFSDATATLLLGGVELGLNNTIFANITFGVQPFVLPNAKLFFSFRVFYFVPSHGSASFMQRLEIFERYTSDDITYGNLSLLLPYYADEDRVEDTFPPHTGDVFLVQVPITVPCVSTALNVNISLPEFESDNYTRFYTNVTELGVIITLPSNLLYINELCQYQDVQEFNSSACDWGPGEPVVTIMEMNFTGGDEIFINFGPLLYNLTSLEDCVLGDMMATSNCSCPDEDIIITLIGHVVTNLPCDNQTLADNITSDYAYTSETTTKSLQLGSVPAIEYTAMDGQELFAVNASMPAISLPINSFVGDAGDSYNLTFGVLHNGEYSSFTTYDLNYTFTVNTHLEPDENITVCFYNDSSTPELCEELPFINYTISRFGFHPE